MAEERKEEDRWLLEGREGNTVETLPFVLTVITGIVMPIETESNHLPTQKLILLFKKQIMLNKYFKTVIL